MDTTFNTEHTFHDLCNGLNSSGTFNINETVQQLHKIEIPKLENQIDYLIIDVLLNILKEKFNKVSINLDGDDDAFIVYSSNEVYEQISFKVRSLLSIVTHNRVDVVNNEMIQHKSCKNILQTLCNKLKLYGVVEVITEKNGDLEPGAYFIYFHDCLELDSPGDSIFKQFSEMVKNSIGVCEIDLNIYNGALTIDKWNTLVDIKLKQSKNNMEFSYSIRKTAEQLDLVLFGIKTCFKGIRNWLNELLTIKIRKSQDQILYLKKVAVGLQQELEQICPLAKIVYQTKLVEQTEFNDVYEYEMSINGCPTKFNNKILALVDKHSCMCKHNTLEMDWLPGFGKMLNKNNFIFQNMIEDLKSSEKVYIGFEVKFLKQKFGSALDNSTNSDNETNNGGDVRFKNTVFPYPFHSTNLSGTMSSRGSVGKVVLFKVIANSIELINSILEKLQENIRNDFIIKENLDEGYLKNIPLFTIAEMVKKTADIEIEFKSSNNLSIVGYIEDVLQTMVKLCEMNNNRSEVLDQVKTKSIVLSKKLQNLCEVKKPLEALPISIDDIVETLDNDELASVRTQFMESFKNRTDLVFTHFEVVKIVNERLKQQYEIYKEYMKEKNGTENEQILFHGTSHKSANDIYRYGFNRSFAGFHGTYFGHGVYFSKNASYSDRYAQISEDLFRRMFLCKVLVGESTIGDSSMKVPPKKPNGEFFDSTTDMSGTIYVAYNDNQCIPTYLITYAYQPASKYID